MGNIAIHDLEPVREDERKDLDLSVPMDYKSYCKVICLQKVILLLKKSTFFWLFV